MHHIFLSYNRADGAWVRELDARLELSKHQTWIDHRDLPLSLDWVDEVRDAITESDLVLVCDSPAWHTSENCAIERSLATQAARRICTVSVGSDLAVAASEVASAMRTIDPVYAIRTELGVLARDWDRAARPRSALAGARLRRRLSQGLRGDRPATAVEHAFLRASHLRSRRRLIASFAVAALSGLAVLAAEAFNVALSTADQTNSEQATLYSQERAGLSDAALYPYAGLADAVGLGGNESAVNANVVSAALRYPTPDDGFSVPAAANRFAIKPIAQTVVVAAADGQEWQRAASATTVRRGTAVTARAAIAPAPKRGPVAYRQEGATGIVAVSLDGRLWRRITFAQQPTVLALSPDGREMAGAFGALVEIVDIQSGLSRTFLRGAPTTIEDLAWTSDGQRIWALTATMAVSWAARDGTVLVDDPGASFEAILAAPNRQAIWLATRDGELREIAISTGRTLATLRVDDQISAAADSADGQVAALSGAHRVWIVPLSGGTVRSVALPNCSLGRAAFRSDALFYLPCLGSTLLTVSVPAAKVIGHFNVSTSGAYAARVMPRSGTLLVGDGSGAVFALTGSTETLLQTSGCGGEILRIAVAPDEIAIAPVGLGAGYISCTTRAIATGPGASSDPSHWEWDHVAESESHSLLAEASAFDLSGDAFAYGYSDGTIVLHPTANIDPTLTFTVAGAIRDMFVSTGDDLLVATANGIVQAIPLCNGCLSDRALARVAVARLQRAIALGILHKPPSTAAASRER